ncbi:hypothetical protein EGW08_021267 [Elysia chlorotica]|uniref:Uncharacterized protein n=1 Tax=Elysia chlorotica TaxID=188477 RepID=A0A433SNZ3_ELYCH|nr:hypothetical protein EGW08_021267 [Elysia chlorotica]
MKKIVTKKHHPVSPETNVGVGLAAGESALQAGVALELWQEKPKLLGTSRPPNGLGPADLRIRQRLVSCPPYSATLISSINISLPRAQFSQESRQRSRGLLLMNCGGRRGLGDEFTDRGSDPALWVPPPQAANQLLSGLHCVKSGDHRPAAMGYRFQPREPPESSARACPSQPVSAAVRVGDSWNGFRFELAAVTPVFYPARGQYPVPSLP